MARIYCATVAVVAGLCLLGSVMGDSSPTNYELPSNATVILGGPVITGFSCDGLKYGYYADVANDCKVFHICYPYLDADGFLQTRMWSFICGLGTQFNQEALVCDHPRDSFPCQEAPNMYEISNGDFGKKDANFRENQ